MTPNELAAELGISPKTLRAWLRNKYDDHVWYTRWHLTKTQVTAARAHFEVVS